MSDLLPNAMIWASTILMAYNIYRYLRYAQTLLRRSGWERERCTLIVPIALLAGFFVGYLVVGVIGNPHPVVAGILTGGSVFVLCMIVFLEHITQRIEEHEHLAAQLEVAQESSRAKTSFLSTMSHEIRTPLNAIIGLNTLSLKDEDLTPTQRDRLEKVDGSARHLLSLINDVLDMSRIESGQMSLAEAPFTLRDLQEHVCGIIGSQCAQKGLTYHCEAIGELDGRYVGDETKLSQVLINIMGNSVKFTETGDISMSVEQAEATDDRRILRFTLSDTGIGMDEEFIPKLFGTFTQEDSTHTTQYGGSGLGMAITKRIVEMMDGSIDVRSTKGVGTTITVTVSLGACPDGVVTPASGEDVTQASCAFVPDADTAAVSLEGRRMLIAEDMPINAEILKATLAAEGIACEHATNGQEAVERFSAHEAGYFDAVLMDVRMPVMDGLAATRALRALDRPDGATVPIIALTANAFDDDVRQTLEAGMDAHLSKPLDPELLYATLRELIGSRSGH